MKKFTIALVVMLCLTVPCFSQWWGGGSSKVSYRIAASDASAKSKQNADIICDGTTDAAKIQAVIDSMPGIYRDLVSEEPTMYGGAIYFSEGTFILEDSLRFSTATKQHCIDLIGSGCIFGTRFEAGYHLDKPMFIIGYDPRMDNPTSTGSLKTANINFEHVNIHGNQGYQEEYVYDIASTTASTSTVVVANEDLTSIFKPLDAVRIYGSTSNDGMAVIKTVTYNSPNTEFVLLNGVAADSTSDGQIKLSIPCILGASWQDAGMEHCFIEAAQGCGIFIRHAWTLYFRRCPIEHNRDAGFYLCAPNYTPGSYLYLINHVTMEQGTLMQDRTDSTNGYFPSGPSVVLQGHNSIQNVWFTNNLNQRNATGGMRIEGNCKNITVDRDYFWDCSNLTEGGYPCIYVGNLKGGLSAPNILGINNCTIAQAPQSWGNQYNASACIEFNAPSSQYPPYHVIITNNRYLIKPGDPPVLDNRTDKWAGRSCRWFDVVTETFDNVAVGDMLTSAWQFNESECGYLNAGTANITRYTTVTEQLDYPRTLKITLTDASSSEGDVTLKAIIYGYDVDGEYMVYEIETMTAPAGGSVTVETDIAFRELYRVYFSKATGIDTNITTSDSVMISYGDKFALNRVPWSLDEDSMLAVRKNGDMLSLVGSATKEYKVGTIPFMGSALSNSIQSGYIDFSLKSDDTSATTPLSDGDDIVIEYQALNGTIVNSL